MAKFPIQTARQELGVTPTTAVRFTGDTRTGDIGGVVGQAALAGIGIIQRIRQKRQEMLDTRSSITAGSFITTAINENIAFRNTNADTMTWAKDLQERLSGAEKQITALDMSEDTRLLVNAKFQAKSEEALSRSLIAETDRDREDTRDAIISDVVEQYTNGTVQDQQDAGKRFLEISSTLMDENEARATLKTAIMAGQKANIENQKKDLMNQAAIKPELITSFIDAELKSRKEGKKAIDEFASMSNTDLEDIRDYANSVGEKAQTDSEIAVDTAIVDAYGKIRDGETDIDAMIDAIEADPTISDKDKIIAAEKIPTYFNKINSIKVADESDEDVYDELTRASESVERGTMSPAAFEELYADKKGELDKDDQRTIRSKDIVATKTMQNRAFTDAMSVTLPTLVEITESEMGAIKLARQNAEIIKDIARVNMFNIAIKKNQAERWNYGRFRKQLRSQIDQNPEWSQKQIYVAQEILVDQLDMPVDQLLKEFDDQNPDRAIMKTPPSIDFKDIWRDLSIDDKAKVWELTMRGAPSEVIIEAIE